MRVINSGLLKPFYVTHIMTHWDKHLQWTKNTPAGGKMPLPYAPAKRCNDQVCACLLVFKIERDQRTHHIQNFKLMSVAMVMCYCLICDCDSHNNQKRKSDSMLMALH